MDAYGNYVCLLTPPAALPGGIGTLFVNSGQPANSFGSNGDLSVDPTTGTVYQKSAGVWAIISGSGGTSQVLSYTAIDPNTQGLVPANLNAEAVAYDSDRVRQNPNYNWDKTLHNWY